MRAGWLVTKQTPPHDMFMDFAWRPFADGEFIGQNTSGSFNPELCIWRPSDWLIATPLQLIERMPLGGIHLCPLMDIEYENGTLSRFRPIS
jgi:hypothetical protein